MQSIGRQSGNEGSVSSVHLIGIGEVLIEGNGLTSGSDFYGKFYHIRGITSSWRYFSVIVYLTQSRLVIGEGRSIDVWGRCSVDNLGSLFIQRIVW